jgi:hypothetical protein
MDENIGLKLVLNYKPEEHRGARRYKKRWKDEFN